MTYCTMISLFSFLMITEHKCRCSGHVFEECWEICAKTANTWPPSWANKPELLLCLLATCQHVTRSRNYLRPDYNPNETRFPRTTIGVQYVGVWSNHNTSFRIELKPYASTDLASQWGEKYFLGGGEMITTDCDCGRSSRHESISQINQSMALLTSRCDLYPSRWLSHQGRSDIFLMDGHRFRFVLQWV